MKRFLLLIILLTSVCYYLNKEYVYIDHKAYIYKFVNNDNQDYSIIFNDVHNEKITINVDSSYFYKLASKEMRKRFYKIRKYDDGKIFIID